MVKLAVARWREVLQFLSPENQRRIQRSGIIRSERTMLLGKMQGNKNRRDQMGYYSARLGGMSPAEIAQHKFDTDQNMYNAFIAGDGIRKYRDTNVLDALQTFNGKRPGSKGNPRSLLNAVCDPYHKVIFARDFEMPEKTGIKRASKNKKPNNRRMLQAMAEEHEILEAQSVERDIKRYIQRESPQNTSSIDDIYDAKKYNRYPGKLISIHDGEKYSGHHSMDVLLKERRILDAYEHIQSPVYKFIRGSRKPEHTFMDVNGKFDPAKALQPGKKPDLFKYHEKEMLKNIDNHVNIGDDIIKIDR